MNEVFLPIEGPTFEVECRYELANCARAAKQKCGGEYEPITRKNCLACGRQVPRTPEQNARVQMPGYRGTLYFRCL